MIAAIPFDRFDPAGNRIFGQILVVFRSGLLAKLKENQARVLRPSEKLETRQAP